jgi:hypothetical protein
MLIIKKIFPVCVIAIIFSSYSLAEEKEPWPTEADKEKMSQEELDAWVSGETKKETKEQVKKIGPYGQ